MRTLPLSRRWWRGGCEWDVGVVRWVMDVPVCGCAGCGCVWDGWMGWILTE